MAKVILSMLCDVRLVGRDVVCRTILHVDTRAKAADERNRIRATLIHVLSTHGQTAHPNACRSVDLHIHVTRLITVHEAETPLFDPIR